MWTSVSVLHSPAGVGEARRRIRSELRANGAPEGLVDDAVLVLSELLSNACRHARPLLGRVAGEDAAHPYVRARWRFEGDGAQLTICVTDGGGATRPRPATPSVTARGGRGLAIITALARAWGVDAGAAGAAHPGPDTHPDGDGDTHPDPDTHPDGDADAVTVWAVLADPT